MPLNAIGATTPLWTPVHDAAPVTIKATPVNASRTLRGFKTACALYDPQIGYSIVDGVAVNFHDERAMAVAIAIMKTVHMDHIVLGGDTMDLTEQGRWAKLPGFARTTQMSLDRTHSFLKELAETFIKSKIDWLAGNHEERWLNNLLANAMNAHGMRRANAGVDEEPLYTLENLLRLKELRIDYIGGYPNGRLYLQDDLMFLHGFKSAGKKGSTALQYLDEFPGINSVYGHDHREAFQTRVVETAQGPKSYASVNPGALCRVDGAVPGGSTGYTSSGRPVERGDNWTQGILFVHYRPGEVHFERVSIRDGRAVFRGRLFEAPKSVKNVPLASVTRRAA